MASAYSFLDIAVLDAVRERFAAGDALAVLSVSLDEILWANGAGAAWLGHADIEEAIGSAPRLSPVAVRQIAALPGFPEIGRDRPLSLRLAGGIRSRLVTLQASGLTLPGGEKALLLALPMHDGDGEAAAARAARIVSGFDEPGHFAALIDAQGGVMAASEGFEVLGIAPETLRSLVDAVRAQEDRLVKKPIHGARRFPAGIARLADEPALHLLVVVDEEGDGATAGDAHAAPLPLAPEAEQEPEGKGTDGAARGTPGREVTGERTVRFAWRTDAQGRFSAISEEFAAAVGEVAADVIGRSFAEVAAAFRLDQDGAIVRLLERRDTWSGRTVWWPVAGTALKVPVDLAALPAYGRERGFEGFRGFGIVRLGEEEPDPERIGLALVSAPHGTEEDADEETVVREEPQPSAADAHPFKGEAPAIHVIETPQRRETDKVIRLAEHRENARENGGLSPAERNAFREIGERLRLANEAAARAAETSRAAEAQQATPQPEEDSAPPARPDLDEAAGEPAGGTRAAGGILPSAFFLPTPPAPQEGVSAAGLLSPLPLPILIHSGDRLHYANRAFFDLTGYDNLEALEQAGSLGALFDEPQQDATQDEPGRTLRLLTADGAQTAVEAHLKSVPWEGRKALMMALRPVAAEKAAQEAEGRREDATPPAPAPAETGELETRLAEMRAIIDTATDGIVIIANDGTIRSISRPAEALFGFDAEHVTGKPFTSLFAIESQRTVADYLASLADNGVASVLNDGRQVIGREAQGRFIPLFITIGRLPNRNGYCAVLRDITHWKRAEEELTQARAQAERASSQKSEFLARVSHEIRTPLNAIIGFSELMIDEKFGPIGNERYRDYLRDINRSGNHVLDLVNDLLDISKIEAGQQEMRYEAVSLNETLGQTVAMMQPQANSERVIIRSSFASRLPDVVADLRSVRQIALNLLSNAVRYTPAGGQVIVSTAYAPDGSVVMRVRDTGVGMSAAELDEALKPFKQINALRRRRGDGTGLGLPLTRAMVEANRAQFSIRSTPGEGTLVEVTFPPTRVLAD